MVTLTPSAGDPVSIPDIGHLRWTDEHDWTSTVQSVSRLFDGAAIVEVAPRTGARPLTLSGRPNFAACHWSTLADLLALLDTAAVDLTVTLDDGRAYRCTANLEDGRSPVQFERTLDAIDDGPDTMHLLQEVRLLILEGPL